MKPHKMKTRKFKPHKMKTRNTQKGGNPAYILWAIGALILLGASQLSQKKI